MPLSRPALLLAIAWLVVPPALADKIDDAQQLYRAGSWPQALQVADDAIAANPRDARMRFLKGVMLADQRRDAEAQQVFVALTEDFPELPDPYNNLAVLYAARGQLAAALAALQTALRNDPNHRAARENLGDVHLALAVQAWAAAASGAQGDTAALQRKLRLAREILPPGATAAAPG